jgi:hypothetical protein
MEYPLIEETIAPVVLKTIEEWINEQVVLSQFLSSSTLAYYHHLQ